MRTRQNLRNEAPEIVVAKAPVTDVGSAAQIANGGRRLRKMTHVVSSCRLARVKTGKPANLQIEPAAPSTAELRREGRLARIAKALAQGATVIDIAEAEGIGRTLA